MKRLFFILLIFISSFGYSQGLKALLLSQAASFTLTLVDSVDISGTQSIPNFIQLNGAGTKMYITDGNDDTYQYGLSTAWDISTALYDSKLFVPDQTSAPPRGTEFCSSTKFYFGKRTIYVIYQYTLSIADDISTASYDSKSYALGFSFWTIEMYNTGSNFVVYDSDNNLHKYYTLSTAYDISTASLSSSTSSPDAAYIFSYNEDGSKLATLSSGVIIVYDLSTNYDNTTFTKMVELSVHYTNAIDLYFQEDYIYVTSNTEDKVYQYEINF